MPSLEVIGEFDLNYVMKVLAEQLGDQYGAELTIKLVPKDKEEKEGA